jgi:hypothetical protein
MQYNRWAWHYGFMYAVKDASPKLSAAEPVPSPWLEADPVPQPWREAVGSLISLVATKEAAAAMANKEAAEQVIAAAEAAISRIADEYCGTRVHIYPGPPPPPWWGSSIASELTVVANTLQQGSFRSSLIQLSSQLLDRFADNSRVPGGGKASE